VIALAVFWMEIVRIPALDIKLHLKMPLLVSLHNLVLEAALD
jgi:hypothetical protein